ncbi:hybrid sensor histidine kinase/response regulator [Pseudanabaena sp. FACHB-1998]|uniref:hybrid sensor histidine kinase/response regulator n=1 Tax=Pseudanabaena sp. FACHB-1998 TaxID=2692858 RepID=UPI0016814F56|nr:hybrid sensor histidine kinase/response regulator [Pseudanabaena sp. FACHB-1998]MBD2177183.1 hybrid sensor histidine kinase/response regulator [Pseudanabaena sp. FACHB-1998]
MTKILVIEDEDLIRDSLEDILLVEGFEVITAENGKKGVYLASQKQPDLILCDVMMPIMNGYEVLEQVRQDKDLSTVPFLFLTSMMDRRSNRKGMALGADDYLEKPCTKDELIEAITVRINRQQAINQLIQEKMEALRSSITLSLPHELQTPLSGIMGLSELMMMQSEELMSSEVYEYANGINRSAERLYRLIQNYLLYSKLLLLRSQGQARFTSPYPCNVLLVISSIGEQKAREFERSKDLEIEINDLDLAISSDDLSKIIEELMDNAFKYSSRGSKISMSSSVVDSKWLFSIRDHGRGMNKEQVANIGAYMQFERRFYEQQGMGLGLVLAKTLVEFYGGDIEVQSEENIGTTVSIVIPI